MSDPTPSPPLPGPEEPEEKREDVFESDSGTLMLLIYDRWFRIVAVLLLFFVVFLGLFLPKIWQVTPPGLYPVMKVSGLDKVQAWALRRSAERLDRAGRFPDAMNAWRSAGGNDPGNPELARGPLLTLLRQPLPDRIYQGYGIDRCSWLLKLTGTNLADLGLVTRFLRRYDLDDMALLLADARAAELPADALPALLVAEFNQRRMDRFGELWRQHEAQFTNDPVLRLHHTAWLAAWGPPATLRSSRADLTAAQQSPDPAFAELAHRLQLPVSFALSDLDGYRRALGWLQEHHADRVAEHLGHWQLLLAIGRRAEAQALARAFSRPPASALDAVGMGRLFAQLGLEDYAAEFLETQLKDFAFYPKMWVLLSQQQVRLKRWTDLRALALTMRNTPDLRGELDGYSQFLAGLADLRLNRAEPAEAAFAKVPGSPFRDPLLAFNVATELRHLGYPALSARLLQTLEAKFGARAEFWFQLTGAAYEARDMEVLTVAAQKAWELEPDKVAHINNHTAVLLVTRQKPEESIQLTLKLLAAAPGNNDRKVNHILALLQNQRLAEAEDMLKALNPGTLTPNESAIANYGWFELHIRRGEKELARKRYPTVERSQLLQPQLDWMDAEFKKL